MTKPIFLKLETFRKHKKFSILRMCRELGCNNVTYHRWKKTQEISGPYKKVVEEYLVRNESSSRFLSQISSDIAVIGLSCYYPGATNIKELWENILARRIQFRRMLDTRLPLSEYHDPDPKSLEKTYLTKAALIDNFNFDWSKLRIPKKTFESTDIAHWLALDTALRAFEDAGYKSGDIPLQNTGVIVGNTLTGEQTRSQTLRLRWAFVKKTLNLTLDRLGLSPEERRYISETMEKIYKSPFFPITEDSLSGGLANTIAGRICNYLNLKGGGYIVDGACSSSLLAVITAANALKMGDIDLALAGGVDISLDPFELVGFARAGALAKDKMRVYDRNASGFIPGEGSGFVVLKRLDDAIKDKNYIYAVIKGWGISSDGKGGIMEPSVYGQALAIERAYKHIPYKITDINFIEGHGTGTAKGDRVELEGISTAITKNAPKDLKRIYGITSFKSIVGHTKAAAGIGGFIKAVLAVNQRILPPTANCKEPSEVFENTGKCLYPITKGLILNPEKQVRGGISSAGFGGINCHVAIESKDAPYKELKPSIDERALFVSNQETEIFVFASQSTAQIKNLITKFKNDLRFISEAEMADLSAWLTKNLKKNAPIKVAVVTDSPESLYQALGSIEQELPQDIPEGEIIKLKSLQPNTHIFLSNKAKEPKIGFLYPGQASQRLNMTRVLFERFEWVRELSALTRTRITNYIYKTEQFLTNEERVQFEKELSKTQITQPAVIFSSLVWTEFLEKLGIEPNAVGGHSLGELTAFYKAGALTKKQLLQFAEFRGRAMTSRKTVGGMVSLLCSNLKAEELIKSAGVKVVIANINSSAQIVVSGDKAELKRLVEVAKKEDVQSVFLSVSNAFHSSFMQDASKKILENKILSKLYKQSKVNLYSCIDGTRINAPTNLNEYFAKQVVSQVNFVELVERMSKECDCLIEVGPGRVLSDLVKVINKEKGLVCLPVEGAVENTKDLNLVLAELFVRNVSIRFEELFKKRLVRPFVPVSKRKFIVNQCERPLTIPDDVPLPSKDYTRIIHDVVSAMANPEVVKEQAVKETQPLSDGQVADILIHSVEKLTGFNKESLHLNLRLLDDLNLDSIKAAELIAEVAKSLGVPGELEPAQYSNRTLDEIRQKFEGLVALKKEGKGQSSNQVDILKRYQDKAWVRNFVEKFEPQPLGKSDSNQTFKNILIVAESDEGQLANRIKENFKDSKVRIVSVEGLDTDKKPECVIAIISAPTNNQLTQENLHERMENIHKILSIAANSKNVLFAQLGIGDFKEGNIRSIASTLHLERPDLHLKIIDFNRNLDEKTVAELIDAELSQSAPFTIAGYTAKGQRQVPMFEVSNPFSYKPRDIQWSKSDVVLVTGGAKGITAECALEFGRMSKAKMILMGRSSKHSDIEKTLERFNAQKLTCEYVQCDVADDKQVKKVIKEIENKFGVVTAVIHGAGLNSLKRLKQANLNDVYKEALPKVMGAVNILDSVDGGSLKLFIPMASIIGVTGMEGSGWYGFANETLVQYLRDYKTKNKSVQIVIPAFSVWNEVGMGVNLGSIERLSERGIGAIPVEEGVKRFRQLIEGNSETDQIIITSRVGGLDTMQLTKVEQQNWRFIEDIKYHVPQVELIVHANLNVKDDPYLLDHNWKGSLLFPMVFGLEAMAQAACYVTGTEKINSLKIADIHLDRPISVSQETGTTIEIHAQILEADKADGNPKVQVEIFSEQTGYKEPHFSALYEMNGTMQLPKDKPHLKTNSKNTLDINPQTDLYGPILFQGEMFQCIDKIHELSYNEKLKNGKCVLTLQENKAAREFFNIAPKFNNKFLIGNLFFIDSMLQSMQVIIPQDISLPRDIEEIDFGLVKAKTCVKCLSQSRIQRIDADYYRGDAQVIEYDLRLKIKNCRLKIIDTIIDNPSANDLVNSAKRDQEILNNAITKYSRELGIKLPYFSMTCIPGMQDMSKKERHEAEASFLEGAVWNFLKSDNQSVKKLDIVWEKNGKPQVVSNLKINPKISVTHERDLIICSVGTSKQSIDLQTILARTNEEWRALLGNKKFELIKAFKKEQLNNIATAIWASGEVCIKAGLDDEQKFQIIRFINDNYYILKCGNDVFVNLVVRFSRGRERILSFLMKDYKLQPEPSINEQLGFGEKYFRFHADYSGPQKQLVTIKRFPVVFKYNKMRSKTVSFCSYFDWIGEVREFALLPILKQLAAIFETKEWGVATNSVEMDIKGELRGGDIVEARMWLRKKVTENVYDLNFEFWNCRNEKTTELIASVIQRISWVKVLGHGKARVNRLPLFLDEIMRKMEPRDGIKDTNVTPAIKSENRFNFGNLLRKFDDQGLLLHEMEFQTTLEESNLVGNIYFANYAIWIGRTVDFYFYKTSPAAYREARTNDEFVCKYCKIVHLNEAMPFDLITVRMYLTKMYANVLELRFDIFSNNNKLATAKQFLVWTKRNDLLEPLLANIPEYFIDNLIGVKRHD